MSLHFKKGAARYEVLILLAYILITSNFYCVRTAGVTDKNP